MTALVALTNVTDADADMFLRMFGEQHTFQTFDDEGHHRRALSRVLHGTLAEHAATLGKLNTRGAGVFVMVNAGDGEGRKTANVQRVRALFVDLDGAPLEPVKTAPLPPHCIVESSPNHWHAYWLVCDCTLAEFTPLQKALACRFNADPKVCDLPRVMRLPGFDHRKRAPFHSRIVEVRAGSPYSVSEFRTEFGLDRMPVPLIRPRTLPDRIPEGQRNDTLFSLGRGLAQKGFDVAAANRRLQKVNAHRCDPPLSPAEVEAIAASACAYGSDGFVLLPHKLLDSQEWKSLKPTPHDLVVMAFRRYDGANNGKIALTWTDFGDGDVFSRGTFYKARQAVLQSGILVLVTEGRNSQTGRKPDLFAIATKWLREFRQSQKSDLAPVPKK